MKSVHLACFCLTFALAPSLSLADNEAPTPAQGAAEASTPAAAASAAAPQPVMPVCTAMDKPEVPALPWKGQVDLQVRATVRDGRVRSITHRAMQFSQPIPTRELLALMASVEKALASYDCPGNHLFEQGFRFVLC